MLVLVCIYIKKKSPKKFKKTVITLIICLGGWKLRRGMVFGGSFFFFNSVYISNTVQCSDHMNTLPSQKIK